jgi:uncharacterized protein (TIGR00369 family)
MRLKFAPPKTKPFVFAWVMALARRESVHERPNAAAAASRISSDSSGSSTARDSMSAPTRPAIGFQVEEIGGGRAIGSLRSGPQHANPMGTLHGGILCDLADAAMGMAFARTLARDESFTTMALTINFFRPVWQTVLRAVARVVNRGKNVGYVECDVLDQDGKQIAKAASTCFVLRGEQAGAR